MRAKVHILTRFDHEFMAFIAPDPGGAGPPQAAADRQICDITP